MKIAVNTLPITAVEADAVVVGVYEDAPLAGAAAAVDQAAGGAVTRLKEAGELTSKQLELTPLLVPAGVAAPQVLLVGLGARGEATRQTAFRAAGAASRQLAGKPRNLVVFDLAADWSAALHEAGLAGAIAGCHGEDLYRREKNRHPFAELHWTGADDPVLAAGEALGDGVNLARGQVNGPPADVYPESFADVAQAAGRQFGFEVEVWDEQRLQAERCGSLLAVGRGSDRPPRLVIMRHQGGGAGKPTLALVGKGVTFDSGGYSIKPSDGMKDMKCDMAGAAAVLGAMQTIARLKLPVNVIGLTGLVENLISGNAYKLGDVLTARNGKTIEVLNTDAEGRLVLADALCVAVDQGADRIVDLATLTGACMVALGVDTAGLMTNDQSWCDAVKEAAASAGEECWQLPMFPEFGEQIKSQVADIKNVGDGRWGGAMTAAKLLEEFVSEKPWVHIDIAGPAFRDKPKPWMDAGASGAFVPTLVELARAWS